MNIFRFYFYSIFAIGWLYCGSSSFAATGKNVSETHTKQIARLKPYHLDQIQLAAKNFMALENQKNHSQWQVGEVNLKTFVPNCVVPLSAAWAPKDRVFRKSVVVRCAKSVSKDVFKTWDVYLPVIKQEPKQDKVKVFNNK